MFRRLASLVQIVLTCAMVPFSLVVLTVPFRFAIGSMTHLDLRLWSCAHDQTFRRYEHAPKGQGGVCVFCGQGDG